MPTTAMPDGNGHFKACAQGCTCKKCIVASFKEAVGAGHGSTVEVRPGKRVRFNFGQAQNPMTDHKQPKDTEA